MIGTADTLLLYATKIQGRAAVAASWLDDARPPLFVPKQDQILGQYPYLPWRLGRVFDESNRMPVAPHQLTHGRPGVDFRQISIIGGLGTTVSTSVVRSSHLKTPFRLTCS